MDIKQYISAIENLKLLIMQDMLGQVPVLDALMLQKVFDWVDKNIEVVSGKVALSRANNRYLQRFSSQFTDSVVQTPFFAGLIGRYLKRVGDLDETTTSFYGISAAPLKMSAGRRLIFDEILREFEDNSMQNYMTQPLFDAIYRSVASEVSLKDLKDELKQTVTGNGRRYIQSTAQMGLDAYTGMVNKQLWETFKFNALIMTGSLIETSSPQCRYGVNELDGILKPSDWPKLRSLAEDNGLVPGTTFNNLMFNKLHWGCRHEFTPTIV